MRHLAAVSLWQRWHEKSPKMCGLWAARRTYFRGAIGRGVILLRLLRGSVSLLARHCCRMTVSLVAILDSHGPEHLNGIQAPTPSVLQIQKSLPHYQLWPCLLDLLVQTFLDVQGRGGHKLGKHVLVHPWRARATIGTTIGGLLQGIGLRMFQGRNCDGFTPIADFIAVTSFPFEQIGPKPFPPYTPSMMSFGE